MTADVVEGPDFALLIAHDDHIGVGNFAQEVVARLRYLACASRAQPHVEVDGFHLPPEPGGIGVIALRKCECVGCNDFGAGVGIELRHTMPFRGSEHRKIETSGKPFGFFLKARVHSRPNLSYRRSSFNISRAALAPEPPVKPDP